jgi:hypothetical protein
MPAAKRPEGTNAQEVSTANGAIEQYRDSFLHNRTTISPFCSISTKEQRFYTPLQFAKRFDMG